METRVTAGIEVSAALHKVENLSEHDEQAMIILKRIMFIKSLTQLKGPIRY